jgi:hypothetical protein
MKRSKACGSPFPSSRSFGFVPLALLACCATACGSGSKTNGPSLDATSGDDGSGGFSSGSSSGSGSSSSGGSSSSSSSGGSGSGAVGDDSGSTDGSSGGGADAGDAGPSDGATDGAEAGSSSGGEADGGDASSSSSGGDAGDASSSSGGGADSGDASSSSSGGGDGGDAGSSSDGGDASSSSGGGDGGDASSSDGGDSAADTGTICNLTGSWALKVDIQVTWPATTILGAGSGTVHLWGLVQGTQSGDTIPGTILPCGIVLPDFNGPSIINPVPTFGVTFPNSLFDGTYLTATSATVNVSSSSPGATFTSPSEANLIGITFANPATAAWPNYATAQTDAVDVVGTIPGVTATSKVGQTTENDAGTYSPIPVGVFGPYADQLYMVLRSVVALNGTLTSCTQASGNASVSHLEDHTIGCHLAAGGTCTSTGALNQASFVDSNSPAFVVSSATFQAQLLTNASTCPNVRAALP